MSIQFRLIPRPWGHECVFDVDGICGSFDTKDGDDHVAMIEAYATKIRTEKEFVRVEKVSSFEEDKQQLDSDIQEFMAKYPTKESTNFLSSKLVVAESGSIVKGVK